MGKVKILVVEDEIIIADNLCDTLEDLGYEALEPAINYTEALIQIKNQQPDIAILDIQLGGMKTGIDIAHKIKENYNFPFIFLTSNSDTLTLEKAKEVMPPAYLVKPFTKQELYTTIEVVLNNFSESEKERNAQDLIKNEAFFVKDKGVFKKLNFDNILFLKSAHVYVEIMLKDNEKQIVRGSLNSIFENLNSKFVQVHRSYIINIDYINQIDNSNVKINNELIPVGAKYKEDLFKRMNLI